VNLTQTLFGKFYSGAPVKGLDGVEKLPAILPISFCVHCIRDLTETEIDFWLKIREHLTLTQSNQ
jgi:hypothetical protein